ncbi:hypothetical protein BVG93_07790 [Serratia marcescens]|nr:hypothetical protein BVG93_07790 [Serratia marcescens]
MPQTRMRKTLRQVCGKAARQIAGIPQTFIQEITQRLLQRLQQRKNLYVRRLRRQTSRKRIL